MFEIIKRTTLSAGVLILSFILAYNAVMESFSPFGLAFTAALSPTLFPFGLIGATVGYILTTAEIIPLRYIASLFIFAVIRGALKESKKVNSAPYIAGIAAFSSIVTGFTIIFSTGFSLPEIILHILESLLTGGAAYFFKSTAEIREFGKGLYSYTAKERISLTVSGLLLILNLASFEVMYINLSLIACTYLIMTVCTFREKYSGCFAAGILGIVVSLATGNMYILFAYTLGAILMTLFVPMGVIASTFSYVIASLVAIPIDDSLGTAIVYAVHGLFGALLFIITPERIAVQIENFFASPQENETTLKSAEDMINKKLVNMGNAIASVSDLLGKVLSTTENMYPEEVAAAQMRSVISKQISNTSDIILGISDKLRNEVFIDIEAQTYISKILKEEGVDMDSLICTVDSSELLTIELLCREPIDSTVLAMLTNEFGDACERYFELPETRETEDGFLIRFSERPRFRINIGSHQITGTNSSRCGDCYTSFMTETGKFIILLSDGMGTGTAAALGSALSVEVLTGLLREGIDFSSALSLTNTAVMVNSGDESLATIDIACIDTYTGKADFYKAGAAATLVRHGRRISKLDRVALPIGILQDVEFSHSSAKLDKGDIILMSSDGIWIGDELRIAKQLSYFKGDSMDDLAERIAVTAKVSSKISDDITVIAARIEAR